MNIRRGAELTNPSVRLGTTFVSQSCPAFGQPVRPARLAASPFRAQALDFIYKPCMLIGKKIEKSIQMLFPKFIILCCFLPMNFFPLLLDRRSLWLLDCFTGQSPSKSLVTTIHLQFALPMVFGPPKSPLPHGLPMQNSFYPVIWDVWQCAPPVSNMKHNKFGTNSESSRRPQNVLLVRSKRARFHAIRVSSQCTAEGQQWIGRISENEGPRFVCVPGGR